ncbi:ShlB/FhaC/HecB family hemolysin secretion/activation protein [Erwinia tracheiphila]|uniref:ShlB/FhaC/HecB family hemolysin secretion/activation protein n=1 Tax=Erwinia tracheiphila TaxID=65700 RepID=UPI0006963C57|nr:ShlB/FhaC/HecB family hemolysin secretion/activation protein [Erwinia tracheiphila]UIA87602.1 ShlB/FhaC/HecB family hemolysin secretion/activation protein [Erwinia tracheiphila]UIA95966.1 ShlB/FhaC/HecB family hemolysin secretion/activation protein [Erwinia tracheiphila]
MRLINFFIVAPLFFASSGYAYSAEKLNEIPIPQRDLDRLERQSQQDVIRNEKLREQRIQQDNAIRDNLFDTSDKKSRHKFKIKEILVEDDDQYEFSSERNAIINAYINTEMGEQEVLNLVKELTNFYIGRGYVTTQVTIVPGSLRSEKLVLKVLWGHISGFLHNDEEPGWRDKMRLFSAMPFATGKRLTMSDIDQGMDNLLRVSPGDRLQIVPTENSGHSLINHYGGPVFPLSVHTGINNSGSRAAGWHQYYLNTSLRNVLGLNDSIGYYYSYNDLDADTDSQSAKSFSFSMPLGYWSFDANYHKSQYFKVIGGNFGGYASDGQSERLSFKVSRTLFRNADGKFTGYAKIEKRKNENNIFGFPIDISSKDYSNLNMGIAWVGSMAGGWTYIDLSMTAGVSWFNSAWKQDSDLEGFDLDYKKYNGMLSWSKRIAAFENGRVGLDYELNSGFQYTNDVLVSDARYSMGDEFSVRGFKEDIVSAERALWISNTLKMPFVINYARIYQISPFTGLDIGIAQKNCPSSVSGCDRDYMSGAAVGVKASGKDFSGSLTSAWPVKRPASLSHRKIDNQTLYFNLDVGF